MTKLGKILLDTISSLLDKSNEDEMAKVILRLNYLKKKHKN